MSTTYPEPGTIARLTAGRAAPYAAQGDDTFRAEYGTDFYVCRNCGADLVCGLDGVRGRLGHAVSDDDVCRESTGAAVSA